MLERRKVLHMERHDDFEDQHQLSLNNKASNTDVDTEADYIIFSVSENSSDVLYNPLGTLSLDDQTSADSFPSKGSIVISSQEPESSTTLTTPSTYQHQLEAHGDPLRRQGRLLLVSLLENFCSLYDRNPGKNHKLFVILCRKLSSMGILESTDFVDEAANIRTVYKRAFRDLVVEAIKGLEDEEEERKLLKFNVDELGAVSNDGLTDSSEGNCSAFNELLASEKSRYAEDFIEMYCLGKGGFGHVFKAQNKLDGRFYAIKKIRFSSIYSSRYQRIVREVKSLALMDHPNIVRYNAAWIEELPDDKHQKKALHDDTSEHFDPTVETATEENTEASCAGHNAPLAMYIQMELCRYTLAEWIARRNALLFNGSKWDLEEFPVEYYRMICANISGALDMNAHENRRIFKGIVRGLQYIHFHGLIHRDLKPHNIFFYGEEHIPKIGDFGLVSSTQGLKDELSPPTSPSLSSTSANLTSGLGTQYGSPEQLSGSDYDEKSDIYSLGIICFELFYPFSTQMERAQVLSELKRSKKFPTEFLRRWPKEAAFIWCCLASDPSNRPSADEILESELLDQDLEEHFLRLSEDNEDLRELLRIQFEENGKLKIENELQALEVEHLKKKVEALEKALKLQQNT